MQPPVPKALQVDQMLAEGRPLAARNFEDNHSLSTEN
jgi:hypothetical protein